MEFSSYEQAAPEVMARLAPAHRSLWVGQSA
jgi:hypothetical protein